MWRTCVISQEANMLQISINTLWRLHTTGLHRFPWGTEPQPGTQVEQGQNYIQSNQVRQGLILMPPVSDLRFKMSNIDHVVGILWLLLCRAVQLSLVVTVTKHEVVCCVLHGAPESFMSREVTLCSPMTGWKTHVFNVHAHWPRVGWSAKQQLVNSTKMHNNWSLI